MWFDLSMRLWLIIPLLLLSAISITAACSPKDARDAPSFTKGEVNAIVQSELVGRSIVYVTRPAEILAVKVNWVEYKGNGEWYGNGSITFGYVWANRTMTRTEPASWYFYERSGAVQLNY